MQIHILGEIAKHGKIGNPNINSQEPANLVRISMARFILINPGFAFRSIYTVDALSCSWFE